MIYHNSFCEIYRSPLGAVPEGTEVSLFVNTDEDYNKCTLRLWTHEDKEQLYTMDKVDMGFQINTRFDNMGICWYYFILSKDKQNINTDTDTDTYYCCKSGYTGGEGIITSSFEGSFQVTVFDKNLKTPRWFKNSIMYQIFPDRFNRRGINLKDGDNRIIHYNWNEKPDFTENGSPNNDFFAGNFKGIEDKLQYMKELGIDAIYFNPIFESASNHRYDTGDYMKVDYMLGTEEEFKELIDHAKEVGINIILDGVFNHTGSDSRYFNKNGHYDELGAFQSRDSKYYSWYKFDAFPNRYECWWNFDTLPNVNENDESYKEYIYKGKNSVISKWLKLGIKGWRLDVADELPNDFLEEMYGVVKEIDKDSVVIAEVWEDASNKRSYGKLRKYVQGKQFDSIMNYPLRNLIIDFIAYGHFEDGNYNNSIDANEFNLRLQNLYNNYPRDIFYSLMNFLSTHDTTRIMNIFEDSSNEKSLSKRAQSEYIPPMEQFAIGIKRLKLAWAFIACFPGVPCIFYGDEIGLTGYKDPFNRGTYPWGNENLDIFNFFKRINKIRKENEVLIDGGFYPLYSKEDVFAFERRMKNESIIFIINRNKIKSSSVLIDSKYCYVDIETGDTLNPMNNNKITININRLSYKIIKKI